MSRVAGSLLSPLLNQELQAYKEVQRFVILLQRGLPASYPVHKWQGNIWTLLPCATALQGSNREQSQVSLPLSLYSVKVSPSKH